MIRVRQVNSCIHIIDYLEQKNCFIIIMEREEKSQDLFDYITEMCENREDVFFIGDVTSQDDSIDLAVEQGAAVDSNYVGTYYPWVKTIDRNTNKLTAVPPSVLMPGIFAANDAVAAEWFAPAGLNRGGIVGAVSVLNRLTHAERDTLYEGKINPIASFPGEGIVAFGQKTLQEKSSALDRINVRRLLINLKKFVASTSRFLVFEQNTSTTRQRFLNTVNPYLESVQQRQGLYTFKVVMDESNNTPDVIDRNILAGQIFLQPAKTAEFIVIDFNILPTGASFSA
jgi:phage tail sheath protein FI